jgi:hypothetical protein
MRLHAAVRGRWVISILVSLRDGVGVLGQRNECVGFAGAEKTVEQITLSGEDCDRLSVQGGEEQESIMGYGGYMTLVNGSPFDWVNSSTHAYQMSTWSWPIISAGPSSKYTTTGIKTDSKQGKPRRSMLNTEIMAI